MNRGTGVELGLVAIGVVLFGVLFVRSYDVLPTPVTIEIDPTAEGVVESWTGIYVDEQKIGYAVSRTAPRPGGGQLRQDRTQLRLVLLGRPNNVTLATDVALSPEGTVERLLAQVRTEVSGVPVSMRVEGRPKGRGMELKILQGGAEWSTIDLAEVPATPSTIYPSVARSDPAVGDRMTIPYFSPLSLGRAEAKIEVLAKERSSLPDGTEVAVLRLRVEHSGSILEAVIDEQGQRIEEREIDGGLGMRLLLESEDVALHRGWPADSEDAVDLIALSSIPIDRRLPGGGRSLRRLVLEVDGPPLMSDLLTASHGDRWDAEQRRLTLVVPDPAQSPSYPLPSQDRAVRPWLRATTFIPSDNAAFVRHAGRVLGEELDATRAADKLNTWVYTNMEKVPVASVPAAHEILRSLRGDCNEHTTLYTALSRSVGLPTRMAAGIVYSESIFVDGAFYYHAWPEVWLGDDWVPVDPTFGQFPADATHVKLVEGPLDRQMEIMGVIGRLNLIVVEAQ